jgi:5S rRNA maturation endonuclease (ribonuclease M5)
MELEEREALLEEFQSQVWDPEPAAFLVSRGLVHSTVDRFGLGYTGSWGDFGALGDYRRALVLPYEDGLGRLRKLRFRPLRPGWSGAKYLDLKGVGPHLFAVRAADNPTVYIAEGELDAMSVWQVGFRAVGVPGAGMFKEEWKYLFRPPHVERVVLVLDPDNSGKRAAIRIYASLKEVVEEVLTVNLPRGLDVNDTLRKYGADTLRSALDV